MAEESIDFVKEKFSEYYHRNSEKIPTPTSIDKREFGFISFNEGLMIRHKGFKNSEDFKTFIELFVPSDAYYSIAYYQKPEELMENKGWLGGDLVFDIDSDHIYSPCKPEHDYWICEICNNTVKGQQPEKCLKCGGNKFKKEAWLCETCLEIAKAETQKLLDFLIKDFGFTEKEIGIYFSGNRGYHVHIENEDIKQLDQPARKEIVDYIIGIGLKLEFQGFLEDKRKIIGPDIIDPGWKGRIAKGVYDLLATSPFQMEKIEGVKKSAIKKITINRETLLQTWGKKATWGTLNVDLDTWKKLAYHGLKSQTVSIDTVVTTDIHRLIRTPLTLHGKTGLKVTPIPLNNLEKFDPLVEAIAFDKGSLRIYVNEAHKFRLGYEVFGPYSKQVVTLPLAAAIYLLCKKTASLI